MTNPPDPAGRDSPNRDSPNRDSEGWEDFLRFHAEESRHHGTLADATAHHAGRLPVCGDEVRLAVRLTDGRIAAIRALARGSLLCRAAASLLCEAAEGRPVREVAGIDAAAMLRLLRVPLTPRQMPRALLPLCVLRELLEEAVSA